MPLAADSDLPCLACCDVCIELMLVAKIYRKIFNLGLERHTFPIRKPMLKSPQFARCETLTGFLKISKTRFVLLLTDSDDYRPS